MTTSPLRSDLVQLVDRRVPRRWTIIDAISGRITRLSRSDWKLLESRYDQVDEPLRAQAAAAGLLRKRVRTARSWWAIPVQLLAFRLPIASIDPIAACTAKHSSFLFSPFAVIVWLTCAMIASASVLVGWSRAENSLLELCQSSGSATALGYSIAVLFAVTKALHELGHATACRRLGVPVGDVGLYFFCGVPCPYCDVSQVWRIDSRWQRAFVMLAGIYVELVLASLATLIWWLTADGPVHLLAMNAMLVCGISTLIFNANPLMRLDGYYVMSDAIGTPNLRRQAALAWQRIVGSRLAGANTGRACWSVSGCGLSLYHAATTIYRWMISGVILMFLMTLLKEWNLWWSGVAMISAFVCMCLYRLAKRWSNMMMGYGLWSESQLMRRLVIGSLALLLVAGGLLFPVRRELRVIGNLDVADAIDVFVPESAWVERVDRELGERVAAGESLLTLRDDQLNIQLVSWKSRQTLAKLESADLKREALRNSASEVSWKLDKANRNLVETQYASLVDRQHRLSITAPVHGVVLPALARQRSSQSHEMLKDYSGAFVEQRTSWCRLGDPTLTCVVLSVTAKQRQQLEIGNVGSVMLDDGTIQCIPIKIDLIDEIPLSQRAADDETAFLVKCRLPADQFTDATFVPLGGAVEARICMEREPVWRWLKRLAGEALRE